MEFRTKVAIQQSALSISHDDKLLMMGSCFTENIGKLLYTHGFKVDSNAFGIVYNPISIFEALHRIVEGDLYTENDLLLNNELYVSLDHHGSFSGVDSQRVLEHINNRLLIAQQYFKESKYILITLGTAFVYKHFERNKIVANCHKIPGSAFEKRLLSIQELINAYATISNKFSDKKIIFTVSPVRHWRDGAVENMRSKAILIESIHTIIEEYKNCFYFPAYEIMMDELRDYRFYDEDMLHPSDLAVKYIWERFGQTYFSEETRNCNERIKQINLLLQHRVKYPDTKSTSDYLKHRDQVISAFQKDYPGVELDLSSMISSSNTGNSI